ncbi:MAG: hypothetical protein BWX93_01693 [Bacteroidetes bacterium ADurb.Bin139]|nr:MAG: hypothetical protein BWX93_01693 [Bacteroidetes bacterium ADurb.Bin139]
MVESLSVVGESPDGVAGIAVKLPSCGLLVVVIEPVAFFIVYGKQRVSHQQVVDCVPVYVTCSNAVVADVVVIQGFPKFDNIKIAAFEDYVFRVDPGGVALKFGLYRFPEDTLCPGIGEPDRKSGKFAPAGYPNGMVLCGSSLVIGFLEPVGALPGSVHHRLVQVCRQKVCPVVSGVPFVETNLILNDHIFLCCEQVRGFGQVLLSVKAVVCNGGLTKLALLCGNHDDTVGSPGTVNGSRGSVLKHVYGFDVVGVDVVQVTANYTVNNIQRRRGPYGAKSSDSDLESRARLTVVLYDSYTGGLALQGCERADRVQFGDVITPDLNRSPGYEFLFLNTVTHNHHFFQSLCVFLKEDFDKRLIVHQCNLLGNVAKESNY